MSQRPSSSRPQVIAILVGAVIIAGTTAGAIWAVSRSHASSGPTAPAIVPGYDSHLSPASGSGSDHVYSPVPIYSPPAYSPPPQHVYSPIPVYSPPPPVNESYQAAQCEARTYGHYVWDWTSHNCDYAGPAPPVNESYQAQQCEARTYGHYIWNWTSHRCDWAGTA